jgi:hypothetical protein
MTEMYRLKPGQESFDIVDGPHAGARFKREGAYSAKEIPATEMKKFKVIPATQGGDPHQAAKDEAAGQKKKTAADKQTGGTKK